MAEPIPVRSRTKTAPPAWQRHLAEFWTGVSELSASGFLAMVAGFICTLLFSAWFFSPTSLAGKNGDYLPRSARDAEAFATVTAMRLGHDRGQEPLILVVGSSTLAQALGAGAIFGDRMAGEGLGDWRLKMLTTPLQSPLDQFALLETALKGQTAASPPVLVLLGVGPTRPGWTAKRQLDAEYRGRVGLVSAWEREERELMGEKSRSLTGVWLIDQREFFILNGTESLLRFVLQRPAKHRIDSYADAPVIPEGRASIAASMVQLPDRMANYLAQTDRLTNRLRAIPGVKVAFIQEPLDSGFIEDFDLAGALAEFDKGLLQEAARLEVPYLPVLANAGLTSEDYHDVLHVNLGRGQEAYQTTLATLVATAIRAEFSK